MSELPPPRSGQTFNPSGSRVHNTHGKQRSGWSSPAVTGRCRLATVTLSWQRACTPPWHGVHRRSRRCPGLAAQPTAWAGSAWSRRPRARTTLRTVPNSGLPYPERFAGADVAKLQTSHIEAGDLTEGGSAPGSGPAAGVTMAGPEQSPAGLRNLDRWAIVCQGAVLRFPQEGWGDLRGASQWVPAPTLRVGMDSPPLPHGETP